MSNPSAALPVSRSISAQWTLHLGALAALLALILVEFRYEVANAVEAWWVYPTYSHCFLIIPISLWLIWEKREEWLNETPSITAWGLLALPFLLLFWLAANIATINEARQIAVVGIMQVAILSVLGVRVFRKIMFPVLYLFAMVPVGQYLVPPMQVIATWFADTGLTLLGVPHFTEGTLIELENGRFEVAEACAGLRFLIATMALGILFAHLTYRKWWKIAAFLVACVVIPLVGNGLRCLGIIMIAHLTDNKVAVGADHLVYGWVFNVAILMVLFWIGLKFRDPQPEQAAIAAPSTAAPGNRSVVLMAGATALAISAGPALAYFHEVRPIELNATAFSRPLELPGWKEVPGNGAWAPVYINPDAQFTACFTQDTPGAVPVDVAVVYYARLREGRSLVATMNSPWDQTKWRYVGGGGRTALIGGTEASFGEAVITAQNQRRLVWSSYWFDGQFTRSGITIKLLQMKTAITGNEGAALIAVSTPINGPIEEARQRLRDALGALDELPKRLAEAGQSGTLHSEAR